MNSRWILAVSCIVMSSSFLHADLLSPIGDGYNSLLGDVYHGLIGGYGGDSHLSVEQEEFAQEVAQKMGVSQRIHFHKIPFLLSHMGPHCAGNHIYLDERDFEEFAKNPEALRIVIAHELVHADKHHALKLGCAGLLSLYCINKVVNAFPRVREKTESSLSFLNPTLARIAANILITGTVSYLASKSIAPLKRMCETQADSEALERLSAVYDKDSLRLGFARYASEYDHKPFNFFGKLFSTHPHFYERYASLGIGKEHAKASAENLKEKVKQYVTEEILSAVAWCACVQQKSKESFLESLKADLMYQARVCSIDQSVAQELLKELENGFALKYFEQSLMYARTRESSPGDLLTKKEKEVLDASCGKNNLLTADEWDTVKQTAQMRIESMLERLGKRLTRRPIPVDPFSGRQVI